ncbi:hypothetical protein ACP70R_003059 [Stipagrostis hirtigluma subsp. patula]
MDSHLDLSSGQNVGSNETSLDDIDSQFASPPEDQDCQKPAHVKATPPVDPSKKRTRSASLGSSSPGSYESRHDDATEDATSEHSEGNHYIEALENIWAKKKEAEALKEVWRKEHHDKIVALEKKKLELHEWDLELRQRAEDCKVMSMDISSMSERQQQYFTRMQDEIIARQLGSS